MPKKVYPQPPDPGPRIEHPPGAQRRLPTADYADPDVVFFVTVCSENRAPAFIDERLNAVVVQTLNWLRTNRGVQIYSFCLMPDHLHLLLGLGPDGHSLGDIIRSMKRFTTKESWQLGYRGTLWQERFYDHILRASEDAWAIAEYIRQNPVRKGMVADPDQYRWSGMPDPL
jgi:putative transposase